MAGLSKSCFNAQKPTICCRRLIRTRTHKYELDRGVLIDVRYAPIATKFRIAAKCRDGPSTDMIA